MASSIIQVQRTTPQEHEALGRPNMARELRANHLAATIALVSNKAWASAIEGENGLYRFVVGSRALYQRWLAGRCQEETVQHG